jgi:drug/metabolite transporter superfamily protein YnfA
MGGWREGGEYVTDCAYSVGIRVTHVEKVFGIGRVCLGLKGVLGTLCAADTHGKSHAAYKEVHVVFRGKEAAGSKRQRTPGKRAG